MELLTPDLEARIPRLGSGEGTPLEQRVIHARLYDPETEWRWYILEYDGRDLCVGLIATRNHALVGQFTLTELESIWGASPGSQAGAVRRDDRFQPVTVRELARREAAVATLFEKSEKRLIALK